MDYSCIDANSLVYNFNYQWKFKLANAFPLENALESNTDAEGRFFYDLEYSDGDWSDVSVPHTFNDGELFSKRMADAGAGQTRTFSFYRKWFSVPKEHYGKKVIIEFEGIRQSCYLYINGKMAGFYENGVAPFGFDLTSYINYDKKNLIAIATDNTSTRDVPFCMAETPNKPDVRIGSYLMELEQGSVPENNRGVGYFWNCNDFNPSLGGLTKNIRLHIKSNVYLTLPIYTNLQTKGTYIFADNFDIEHKKAKINILSEVRNESGKDVFAKLECVICGRDGNVIKTINSEQKLIKKSVLPKTPPLTITPESAYVKSGDRYVAVEDESKLPKTETKSMEVTEIQCSDFAENLDFWSIDNPYLYNVYVNLIVDGRKEDSVKIVTGFRKVDYDGNVGLMINNDKVWLTGYAQRAANEWAAIGVANDWIKDFDAKLIRESNANHIRWMHVAACPADIRSCDRYGIVCTQPAGDKERENFGRQWKQRVELMRDVIIYFRNSPSIIFWETGNNAVNREHMREMRLLKGELDPNGGRYMGCRTLSTKEVVDEAEYVGTMLNRHAGRFQSEKMPITETEYCREESPRRVWDDFSPPDFDYDNLWVGKGGVKQLGRDVHDLNAEEFAICTAGGYSEFFNDRMGGASGKNLYSAAAALCWTDSIQHGRQSASENARMSGRVDGARVKKQNFDVYRVMQSDKPMIKILGHWNYPKIGGENYKYPIKKFNGQYWEKTGEYDYRNPKSKTVYVVGSYDVGRIELYINGKNAGVCDKPKNTFIFEFPDIDVTKSGYIGAKAYDYDGNMIAEDRINTVGEPKNIRLTMHTGERGFLADGEDIAFFDVEVVDENGEVCPLCYDRIDFDIEGEGIFLGGYNSGKYDGYGKNDSVIHKNYVFAECGTNRVFVRSTQKSGRVKITAKMSGAEQSAVEFESVYTDISDLTTDDVQTLKMNYDDFAKRNCYRFNKNERADKAKYVPETKTYCKVLINGDEADTHGMRVEYEHGAVWGPIVYVLERIKRVFADFVDYTYDSDNKILTINSKGYSVVLQVGHTHMIVNDEENLLNGEPCIKDGIFWAEISAVMNFIGGVTAFYDDDVNVYRVVIEK